MDRTDKAPRIARGVCAALCCLGLLVLAVWNRTLFLEPAERFLRGEIPFSWMKDEIQSGYTGDRLRGQPEFITLNGGFERLCGRTRVNGVQRMRNGMLTFADTSRMNMKPYAKNVTRLFRTLEARGIPFLFVMAPEKTALSGDLLPAGSMEEAYNPNADEALALLRGAGVPCLDLRETLSATPAQVEAYFYRTDHHWNADGALRGYQEVMGALRALDPELEARYTDAALWRRFEQPDWWLGSHGKRVGALFAGLDPLNWYLPAFDTADMTLNAPGFDLRTGDFAQANLQRFYREEKRPLDLDNYHVYIGGDYPLILQRNPGASNPKRLLLIRDSFALPLMAFLSVEFQEIDAVDPRYYQEMTVAEYLERNPPDLVVMMNHPSILGNGRYNDFGLKGGKK